MPADLDTPIYLPGDVRNSTGIPTETLRNWTNRKPSIIVLGDADRKAAVAGQPNRYTLRRVIQIGITYRLSLLGADLRAAADAAIEFTDTGDEGRAPGYHFTEGETYLALRSKAGPHIIFAAPPNALFSAVMDQVQAHSCDEHAAGAIILNLTETEELIRAALGVDREVLRGGGEHA